MQGRRSGRPKEPCLTHPPSRLLLLLRALERHRSARPSMVRGEAQPSLRAVVVWESDRHPSPSVWLGWELPRGTDGRASLTLASIPRFRLPLPPTHRLARTHAPSPHGNSSKDGRFPLPPPSSTRTTTTGDCAGQERRNRTGPLPRKELGRCGRPCATPIDGPLLGQPSSRWRA